MVPTATKEASVDRKNDLTSNVDVSAVENGLIKLFIVNVNVCAGINAEDELMLVNSIVLDNKFITHKGLSIMFVPVILAHAVAFDPMLTYVGNLIRILPLELNPSFIVIEKVYEVILFTTSLPLPVKDPLIVVAIGVSDW